MRKTRILAPLYLILILIQGLGAQTQEARARYETMKMIRKEKFDLILPDAMRDNNIDMWIHVMMGGINDPLTLDLGVSGSITVTGTMTFVIFTDRGDDRIERALLGAGRGDLELYDIFGAERDLHDFVVERNPRRIAINMSDWLPASNGLTHTGYLRLVKMLGDKYASRLISAENLITDFRVRRVQAEIIAFAKICETQRQLMEEAYRRIVPGVTTREELGWWFQEQLLSNGLITLPSGLNAPSASYSTAPGLTGEVSHSERENVYQRGDFLTWDVGLRYLNFGTDFKRKAYILKEGETSLPAGIQHVWDQGIQAREIIRKTIKIGYTAGEMEVIVIRALEDAGFIYTENTDIGSEYRVLINALGDSGKTGFFTSNHSVGNTGNSEIAAGPSMGAFRKGRFHFKIQQNHLFAFEFHIHAWVPELGKVLSINFEDDSIVTEKGVEALYPRNDEIILIP